MRYLYFFALLIVGAPLWAAVCTVTHAPHYMPYVLGGVWGFVAMPTARRIA